jgi:hypothetical protein
MANIVGMRKKTEGTELTLELNDIEMRNLDLNNPVIILSKSKLNLRAATHKVPSKSGKSVYILLPAGLKKISESIPLKEKQEFSCGSIETAEGGYIIYQYEK